MNRFLLPVLLALVALSGCDAAEDILSIEISLANESTVATHLLAPNEDFSPSNKVEPGRGRTRRVSVRSDQEDVLDFRAGRNGVVLATVSCNLFDHTGQFVVVFNANETLSCP